MQHTLGQYGTRRTRVALHYQHVRRLWYKRAHTVLTVSTTQGAYEQSVPQSASSSLHASAQPCARYERRAVLWGRSDLAPYARSVPDIA
eukprot:950607-Rhodomonas_salina.2